MFGALGVFITARLRRHRRRRRCRRSGRARPSVWLSVVATAVVAVAFQPVRERVQRFANRLVYGARATPYEVLSDFADGWAGRYATAELLPEMAQDRGPRAWGRARVEVWLRDGGGAGPRGRRGRPRPDRRHGAVVRVPVDGQSVPVVAADRVVPVRHGDELLGVLAVTKPPGEPVTPAEDEAARATSPPRPGWCCATSGSIEDLRSSRQRLVTRPGRGAAPAGAQPARRRAAEPGRRRPDAADGPAGYEDPGRAAPWRSTRPPTSCSWRSRSCVSWRAGSTRRSSPSAGSGPALTSLAERSPGPGASWTPGCDRRLPAERRGHAVLRRRRGADQRRRALPGAPRSSVVVTDERRRRDARGRSTTGSAAPTVPAARAARARRPGRRGRRARFTVVSPPGEGTRIVCRCLAGPRRSRRRPADRASEPLGAVQ